MTYRSLVTVRVVLTVNTVTRRLDLLVPTTAPPGALEQVAGLLLHQATRGDRDRVSLLLQGKLRASGEHARTLRNARAQAGLLARATPVPKVVIRALDLVDRHGGLRDEGIRGLLHAAGLSQGSADRALVLGLAGLYGLTEACSRAEQREILAVMPPLVSIGAWSSDICWTEPQRRELRRRRGVPDGPWLVRCDDWTSRLSHSVQRYLAVRSPATVAELLLGVHAGICPGCSSATCCRTSRVCGHGSCSRTGSSWTFAGTCGRGSTCPSRPSTRSSCRPCRPERSPRGLCWCRHWWPPVTRRGPLRSPCIRRHT